MKKLEKISTINAQKSEILKGQLNVFKGGSYACKGYEEVSSAGKASDYLMRKDNGLVIVIEDELS